MFLGHFLQKIRLYHTQLYMKPQHHAKFQKKTNEPIPTKLTDRPHFIGPSGRGRGTNNWQLLRHSFAQSSVSC